ncbi:hypothetical protein GC163_01600 [bacterium]|nr:hypothetical protein [bacterium]
MPRTTCVYGALLTALLMCSGCSMGATHRQWMSTAFVHDITAASPMTTPPVVLAHRESSPPNGTIVVIQHQQSQWGPFRLRWFRMTSQPAL